MSQFNGNPDKLRDWFRTLPDGLQAYCLQAVENVSKDYRILCFSNSCDTILMWSHYGAGDQRHAIGCDSKGSKHALGANELKPGKPTLTPILQFVGKAYIIHNK
jgi:hypothetical protein